MPCNLSLSHSSIAYGMKELAIHVRTANLADAGDMVKVFLLSHIGVTPHENTINPPHSRSQIHYEQTERFRQELLEVGRVT